MYVVVRVIEARCEHVTDLKQLARAKKDLDEILRRVLHDAFFTNDFDMDKRIAWERCLAKKWDVNYEQNMV